MSVGKLTVVGTGIQLGQISAATVEYIKGAEKVLYVVADPVTSCWIEEYGRDAESLAGFYDEGRKRIDTYNLMANEILRHVRSGKNVCAVFYGHPGVFATPSHKAIAQAREEGFEATMIPAVSAEDCLFADLGVDPGACGCQSYEATDFLVRDRIFDPHSHLIIWQIGVIGELGYAPGQKVKNLNVLADKLSEYYPGEHIVTIYEASVYATLKARTETTILAELANTNVSVISTLYLPPKSIRKIDASMALRLGIPAN